MKEHIEILLTREAFLAFINKQNITIKDGKNYATLKLKEDVVFTPFEHETFRRLKNSPKEVKELNCPKCKARGKMLYFCSGAKDHTVFETCSLCEGTGTLWEANHGSEV